MLLCAQNQKKNTSRTVQNLELEGVKDSILNDIQSRHKTYADKAKLTKELGRAPCRSEGNHSFFVLNMLCKQMVEDMYIMSYKYLRQKLLMLKR